MKRRMQAIAPVLLVAWTLSAVAFAGGGEASVLYGQRALAEDEIEDADADNATQYGVAVSLDFDWPFLLALDLLSASKDKTQDQSGAFPYQISTEVQTLEFDVGVRKFFLRDSRWRPFIGGGLAWVQLDAQQIESGSFGPGTEYSTAVVDDSDGGVGLWLDGGFLFRFGSFHVGVDARWSDASADIAPIGSTGSIDIDSGGIQYAAAFGYHW